MNNGLESAPRTKGHRTLPLFLGLFPGILCACAPLTTYQAYHGSQGPLYRRSLQGVEEAIPEIPERRAGPFVIRLGMVPDKPKADEAVRISFIVEDHSVTPPAPVRAARLACEAEMPNIPGHIHTLGIHTEHPEVAPGRYEMAPIAFGMGGRWDLVFQAVLENGKEFYGTFPITVQGPPGPVSYSPPKSLRGSETINAPGSRPLNMSH